MLYNFASYNFLNPLRYITFRSICSFLIAFLVVFCFGNRYIKFCKKFQQPIREDGPQTHLATKQGTPTMGGILILITICISTLLFGNLTNIYIWLCLIVLIGFGIIGVIDDYKKVSRQDYHGISAKTKFLLQVVIAGICCYIAMKYMNTKDASIVYFPAFKRLYIDLGVLFIPWAMFVIIGSSNAVNITDGLDGLAIGSTIISAICFAIICYMNGHVMFAKYLNISYIPGISEVCIVLSALVGASLGFMWFNAPPAKIFMGDAGSISIGALLGFIAVISKHEFLYAIIGGIFVIEAVSVILQVSYYKLTKKRIFLMAPIHHHFEKLGISEPTIVFRFWIISIILGILGMALLKIR